jgi:hypothetical protein
MKKPGWLKIGLWLIRREYPNDLFRVSKIVREFIELEGLQPGSSGRVKISYLHQSYLTPRFFECDDCRRKPGSPTLCENCIQRRYAFSMGGGTKCELPRFCSKTYLKYPEGYLPMECPTQDSSTRVTLSRYQRPWVI